MTSMSMNATGLDPAEDSCPVLCVTNGPVHWDCSTTHSPARQTDGKQHHCNSNVYCELIKCLKYTKYLLIILSNNWRRHNIMCVCRYQRLVWTTCVLMFVNLDWIRAESWRADLNCIINTFTRGCRVEGSNVEERCRLRPQ